MDKTNRIALGVWAINCFLWAISSYQVNLKWQMVFQICLGIYLILLALRK
jgi:hypothetical protein